MKKIFSKFKYIKFIDIIDIFSFSFILPIALIYKSILRTKKKEIWIICEDKNEARDNGYHLFKYIRTEHPEINIYYAITKNSPDFEKVNKLGNIIYYRSLKHWIYYLSANKIISTQKNGNPSSALFYILQRYGILKNNRIFLQHGIIMNDNTFVHFDETRFKLFVCGAKKEFEYVNNNFGYPEGVVKYLGLARYDNLHEFNVNKQQIVLMPTWRDWLAKDVNFLGKSEDFINTNYFKKFNSLINNEKLIDYIEKNNIIMYFFPHRNMQKFIKKFNTQSNNIRLVTANEIDIQDLLKDSALMITDYSSVNMDFAYMKKPLIYYQFDKEEYRKKQYKEGYFSYENDGFGPVIDNEEDLIEEIIKICNSNYVVEDKYLDRINSFFELYDTNNCKRNYEAIVNL